MDAYRAISREMFDLYVQWNGDIDMYQRRRQPNDAVVGQVWGLIGDLRQRLYVAVTGRGSEHYNAAVENDLAAWTESVVVIDLIRKMVQADAHRGTRANVV